MNSNMDEQNRKPEDYWYSYNVDTQHLSQHLIKDLNDKMHWAMSSLTAVNLVLKDKTEGITFKETMVNFMDEHFANIAEMIYERQGKPFTVSFKEREDSNEEFTIGGKPILVGKDSCY